MWRYRDKKIEKRIEHDDRLEIHRDDLTFELLQTARAEVAGARVEMGELRDEVRTLRALEQHFYHFQQAIDHLDAVLYAPNAEARAAPSASPNPS
jgi:multidrug resistance efflux pump